MLKQVMRRREVILETEIMQLCEPGILWWFFSTENIESKFVEQVARESSDHAKDSELPDVEKSFTRQAACQEAYHRSRGTGK
jgi:hypothetical protein